MVSGVVQQWDMRTPGNKVQKNSSGIRMTIWSHLERVAEAFHRLGGPGSESRLEQS